MPTLTRDQLRDRIDDVLRRVAAGETFTITVDGRSVAELSPSTKRRGVGKQELARIWPTPEPASFTPHVDTEPALAEYVPFEPRSDAQSALRQALREKIARLEIPPGHVLMASYHRPLPPRADVENVLLYNIGGAALNRAVRRGVRFELAPASNDVPAYAYSANPPGTDFGFWREAAKLVRFDDVAITSTKLADVWWAVRKHRQAIAAGDQHAGLFAMRLDVRGPTPLSVESVKGLIDGIVAALQHMPAEAAPPALERYAAELDIPETEFRAALVDPVAVPLGTNERLLRKRWAPADDRLVAAEILHGHGLSWRISGSVSAALPYELRASR